MKVKEILKKCLWIMLVFFLSFLMLWAGRDASENIWIEGEPTFRYYVAIFWEILKGIAVLVPVWFLVLVGSVRSFMGENWFPFSEKIPARTTKIMLVVSAVLLVGVTTVSAVYSEFAEVPYRVRYAMENRLEEVQTVSAWILFYSILLCVEQWCIKKNCGRQDIRKKQRWVIVTIFLTWLILVELSCVDLWYIPLSYVDCPNDLEDYDLWWFALYSAVFYVPLLFFAARKTVRLFKNNTQWLTLSTIVPKKVTTLIALVSTGFMIAQIQESRYWNDWAEIADVPEYGQAAATGHTFQAMMWGLVLFYAICLLVKQLRAAHRAKRTSNI